MSTYNQLIFRHFVARLICGHAKCPFTNQSLTKLLVLNRVQLRDSCTVKRQLYLASFFSSSVVDPAMGDAPVTAAWSVMDEELRGLINSTSERQIDQWTNFLCCELTQSVPGILAHFRYCYSLYPNHYGVPPADIRN